MPMNAHAKRLPLRLRSCRLIFSNPELLDAGGLQSANAFFRTESAKEAWLAARN
jgi:hypothetical protein